MLPILVDPADMFVLVNKVFLRPRLASRFVKTTTQSSSKQLNDTRLFLIAANDGEEIVGNVTLFVELSAFNSDYTRYKRLK